MALSKKQQEEMYEAVIELKTAVIGANGKGGLLDKVEALAQGHGKLKKNFWMLVGILSGSGVLAGGLVKLLG